MSKKDKRCPGCGAGIGVMHQEGCDVERCSVCKGQRFACICYGKGCKAHDPIQSRWEGSWPGEKECIELGWFVYWGPPWKRCSPDHPDARPDLNRWAIFQMTGKDPYYED